GVLAVTDATTPIADWVIILPVLLGLTGSALLLMLRRRMKLQWLVAVSVALLVLASDLALFWRVTESGPLTMTMGRWLPPFGISFTADALGAGFALVGAFTTLGVLLYLRGTAPDDALRNGVYPRVLLLLAGVSGAFLTGDLFNLYVWFEVMLIASFGLIVLAGYPLQLDAAVKYGILNFLATALFLLALGLLYGLLGTLNMADIIRTAAEADLAPLVAVAAVLALAFGMKAAVFPVNAWLPASYHAPPAAISALMGGLLTKVGAYALLRTMLMLMPEARGPLEPALLAIAMGTAVLGPFSAIAETNLRRAIGFILIGGVGLMLLPLWGGTYLAVAGGLAYGAHAMLTLTALYLVAGLIERATGLVDTRRMGGLYAAKSALSAAFLVLVLAVAGVPPFLGFWPKLLLLQGFIATEQWVPVFTILINAALTLIAGSRLWSHIFWRGTAQPAPLPFGPSAATWLLAAAVLVLGLFPAALIDGALLAARDLLYPSRYIASVGLAP
ncbi:MAG TPA: proton-conducting transporter membrane subunit, partial [Devosia sp.]|nr:proton-conducting transporter membrane subunit [Devosia sp.]